VTRGAVLAVLLALAAPARAEATEVSVCFSPEGRCGDVLVREIRNAEHSVRGLWYSFTYAPLVSALIAAHNRGVDVEIVLDRSNLTARASGLDRLLRAGVPVWIDSRHAIMHDKIAIIDGRTVLTGSFNATAAAHARNAENLVTLRGPVGRFLGDWEEHRRHSRRLEGVRR
jgi:phosphatidylserine/phosphatidylglycerophosphate/cardiolipin synthase-like enzyme